MHVMRARLSVALRPSWSVGGMMRANVGIEQHAEDSRLRISREKLHKLGALSKLEIPTEPAPQRVLQIDLEKMYNLFDMLHQVRTEGVVPMYSPLALDRVGLPAVSLAMHEDTVSEGNNTKDILANSKQQRSPFFVVPKVIGASPDNFAE